MSCIFTILELVKSVENKQTSPDEFTEFSHQTIRRLPSPFHSVKEGEQLPISGELILPNPIQLSETIMLNIHNFPHRFPQPFLRPSVYHQKRDIQYNHHLCLKSSPQLLAIHQIFRVCLFVCIYISMYVCM